MSLLFYGAVCLAPCALFWFWHKAAWAFTSWSPQGRPRPAPDREARLRELVADLRRLDHDSRRLAESDAAAVAHRLHALELAYDDSLLRCRRELGLGATVTPPLTAIERLQAEAELAQHGLTW